MVATFLSDEVISSTELRTNQKHWFEKATEKAITILNGRKQFTLINRERISDLYAQVYFASLAVNLCQAIIKNNRSTAFPWIEYLNEKEKKEFHDEYLDIVSMAFGTNDWRAVEQLIEDWKATALAIKNPTLVKALTEEEEPSKYVRIKD